MDATHAGSPPPDAGPPCVFARALLAACAECSLARRSAVGEREGVACASPVAHMNCTTLYGLFVERSAFALRIVPRAAPLSHAVVMKLQCGGILGLRDAMEMPDADVHALVVQAHARHASLAALPWPPIVAAIARWQGRRRAGGRPA